MYTGISLDQAPPEDIPFRFFLTAPAFGVLAGILILAGGEDLFFSNWGTETIALTHLFTLGWLAMIMMGSFYQMVPVLVGGTVPYIKLSRGVHAVFTAGVIILIPGIYLVSETAITIAMAALIASLSIFIFQTAVALFQVEADRPTVIAMRVSIISLAFTMLLGIYFSGAHAGLWEFPDSRIQMTTVHLTTGLFGWVGTLIMGVGFHVIPMFYMTPQFPSEKASVILGFHIFTLILFPLVLLAGFGKVWAFLAWMPGFAAMLIFVKTMVEIINRRRRKIMDATLRSWRVGLLLLPLSLLAFLAYQFVDHAVFLFLFGILFIMGFAVTVTTGMLYKIVPFLVWFHRFSLLIGKFKVPLLKDISPDKSAGRQVNLFIASLVLILAGVTGEIGVVIRLGGLAFAISSLMLMISLIKMVRMKAPELPDEEPGTVHTAGRSAAKKL